MYNDASRLKWRNVKLEHAGDSFHHSFERRKNVQFRQDNNITVATTAQGPSVRPLKLLHMIMLHTGVGGYVCVSRLQ